MSTPEFLRGPCKEYFVRDIDFVTGDTLFDDVDTNLLGKLKYGITRNTVKA